MKTRAEKAAIIDELVEKFNSNPYFYITDASGLSVAEVNKLRRICFDKGITYRVEKNTLIQKALEKADAEFEGFDDVLKGFSGVMFHPESGNAPAKVIKDYRKASNGKRPVLKGASIDSDLFVGDENLDMLASLKSKNELIADVVALLQSPAKNVISSLQSGKTKLAGIVKTLQEREQ